MLNMLNLKNYNKEIKLISLSDYSLKLLLLCTVEHKSLLQPQSINVYISPFKSF